MTRAMALGDLVAGRHRVAVGWVLLFCAGRVFYQQLDQFTGKGGQGFEVAHANLHLTVRPFVRDADDADVHDLGVAARSRLGQDADADPSLNHAAGGLKIADLNALFDGAVLNWFFKIF